jgi:hypothetical protein
MVKMCYQYKQQQSYVVLILLFGQDPFDLVVLTYSSHRGNLGLNPPLHLLKKRSYHY